MICLAAHMIINYGATRENTRAQGVGVGGGGNVYVLNQDNVLKLHVLALKVGDNKYN